MNVKSGQEPLSKSVQILHKYDLLLGPRLGAGVFSEVYSGYCKGLSCPLAFKVCKPSTNTISDIVKEANKMVQFEHKNVLRFLGISNHEPIPWIILEYMPHGDLVAFMKECRESGFSVDQEIWMQMTTDIAEGMEYLNWEKLLVHCDLHAGNCMLGVSGNDLVAKVGDFGLSYMLESNLAEEKMLQTPIGFFGRPPIPPEHMAGARFKAPELIFGPDYIPLLTRPADVWAYGIVLFELWTLGLIPFAECTQIEIAQLIISGTTPLDCIENRTDIPKSIMGLMLQCWNYAPIDRPNFIAIVKSLKQFSAV